MYFERRKACCLVGYYQNTLYGIPQVLRQPTQKEVWVLEGVLVLYTPFVPRSSPIMSPMRCRVQPEARKPLLFHAFGHVFTGDWRGSCADQDEANPHPEDPDHPLPATKNSFA